MSELDGLDPFSSLSESGVVMRPKKPKPVVSSDDDLVARVTKRVVDTLARPRQHVHTSPNVLTSTPAPVKSASKVDFNLTRNAEGQIDGGTASNGDATWRLSINRLGGGVSVAVTRI
jgi:hypothetical protein